MHSEGKVGCCLGTGWMGWGWTERGQEEEEARAGLERELGHVICGEGRGSGRHNLIEFFRTEKTLTRELRILPLSSFRIMSMS